MQRLRGRFQGVKPVFAAEVEKIKGEAARRGNVPRDTKGRVKPSGKKISPTDKESAKTTTTLARAAGTNRAYLETAAAGQFFRRRKFLQT